MNAPYATFCAAFRAPDLSGSRTVCFDDGPEGRVERGESQRREERGERREERGERRRREKVRTERGEPARLQIDAMPHPLRLETVTAVIQRNASPHE